MNVHLFRCLRFTVDLFFSLHTYQSSIETNVHVLIVRYEYGFVSVEEAWDTIAASYATRVAGFTGARFPHLLFRRMFPPSVM